MFNFSCIVVYLGSQPIICVLSRVEMCDWVRVAVVILSFQLEILKMRNFIVLLSFLATVCIWLLRDSVNLMQVFQE